ncbi:hypothetical protein ACIQEY_11730 [Streptomyces parvus]|uniref:hypothetical protein n=1 Tax=Streptomyces parvus TaxID=66428 RepID=UPI00381D0B34
MLISALPVLSATFEDKVILVPLSAMHWLLPEVRESRHVSVLTVVGGSRRGIVTEPGVKVVFKVVTGVEPVACGRDPETGLRIVEVQDHSVRSVSGGLPSLGKRR